MDIDETGVIITRGSCLRERLSWSNLERVSIRTTNKGPFDDDVFIVLATPETSCWVPQAMAASLRSRLQQFPGFNNESLIEAMPVEDNEFVCWTRADNV